MKANAALRLRLAWSFLPTMAQHSNLYSNASTTAAYIPDVDVSGVPTNSFLHQILIQVGHFQRHSSCFLQPGIVDDLPSRHPGVHIWVQHASQKCGDVCQLIGQAAILLEVIAAWTVCNCSGN